MLNRTVLDLTVAVFALTAMIAVPAENEKKEEGGKEVKVKFEQLSAAVKKTLEAEAHGAKITEVDKEKTKNGKFVYEADVAIDGKNWEIKVAEDGRLISKQLDEEENEQSGKH